MTKKEKKNIREKERKSREKNKKKIKKKEDYIMTITTKLYTLHKTLQKISQKKISNTK